ncbi:MAG: DNA repair protein RadC [Lachnospiraceae bacterium]|nr:DNA repair protein RadC [Lachnospiraceae bacterium]
MKNRTTKPGCMMPDEKARLYGIESLSDAELLALIVRSGTKGVGVLELSERMIRELGGSIGGIVGSNVEALDSLHGVGRVKTMQLTAIGELSRRIWNSRRDTRVPLTSSKEVYEFFREDLRHTGTEEVHLALLDVKCCLIRHEHLTRGTLRSSPVSPREVFETALRFNAASFILLHNHPSGDCTPSRDDREITRTLKSLGQSMQLPILDHIIIGNPGYYSFKDSGDL